MIQDLENALLAKVGELAAPLGYAAEPFPEGAGGYAMTHPKGVLLVVNKGSRYDAPDRTDGGAQRRTLAYEIIALTRGLRGPTGVYDLMDALARGLANWKAPGCLGGARLTEERFVAHEASVWTWSMGVEMTTYLMPEPQEEEYPYGAPVSRIAIQTGTGETITTGATDG